MGWNEGRNVLRKFTLSMNNGMTKVCRDNIRIGSWLASPVHGGSHSSVWCGVV